MKKKKKLKIKGITGWPMFITRWHGYLDGKRGAVSLQEGQGTAHFVEHILSIYHAFVHNLYQDLEERTAPLHRESLSLLVECEDVRKRLTQPYVASGDTPSSRQRNAERWAASTSSCQSRLSGIPVRLAEIEEILIGETNAAAATEREAAAHTSKRIQAYLHGASLAARRALDPVPFKAKMDFDCEADYLSRHKVNDELRRMALASIVGVN